MTNWQATQAEIQACRDCEAKAVSHLRVPCGDKRSPPWTPVEPVRLYFVSVAPPWGGDYFWDETRPDAVREGLFTALRDPLGVPVRDCRQFRDLQLFLTPAVKCPSSSDGKDHAPSASAVKNCGHFLRSELLAAKAERILALGRTPVASLCETFGLDAPRDVASFRQRVWWVQFGATEVPLSGTYFPGNDRHQGFSLIGEDIGRLLTLSPRATHA
jgi:uracil-DNA glycosylase